MVALRKISSQTQECNPCLITVLKFWQHLHLIMEYISYWLLPCSTVILLFKTHYLPIYNVTLWAEKSHVLF